jgi:glycosyltransferase involved in cell wall biosynthesis
MTLDSILQQSYPDFALIVVNDGSTDGSQAIVEKFVKQDFRVTLINSVNRGPYAARNLGLKESTSEWVAFIDADDVWHKNKLEQQFQEIDEHSLDFVFSDGWIVGHSNYGNRKLRFFQLQPPDSDDIFTKLLKARANFIPQSSVLVRRKLLKSVGGFRELPLAADFVMWLEIAATGRSKIGYIDEPLFDYRLGNHNISKNTAKKMRILNSELYRISEYCDQDYKKEISRRIISNSLIIGFKERSLREPLKVLRDPSIALGIIERVACVLNKSVSLSCFYLIKRKFPALTQD